MKRLAPSLVIDEQGAWVTRNFVKNVYIGEPSNAVRIFNELMADELSVCWVGKINSTWNSTLRLISSQAAMPITYSGRIDSVEQAQEIIRMGFERIALTSSYLLEPSIAAEVSNAIGRSSLLVKLPVTKQSSGYIIWDWRGAASTSTKLLSVIENLDVSVIGEIVGISVDRNGSRLGPDLELAEIVASINGVQSGYEGGVNSILDILELWNLGIDVAYSSSMLMIYGKYDAPLIDYPDFYPERYQ